MAFVKSPMDEIVTISQAGEIQKRVFEDLKNNPIRGFREVKEFCFNFRSRLQDFDARWVELCKDDENELTLWADRVRSMNARLEAIERQLKLGWIAGWGSVISSMGNLDAHRVAIEQTLALNEQYSGKK